MNEIELSNDLNVITAEINTFKKYAGMSVWEIGRRIKHVKEHNLAHGEYIRWLNDELKMDRSEATRYIKISDEIPNDDTWQHLSIRATYLITTLPEEIKQEEIKKVQAGNVPTVREVEKIKKDYQNQLKAKDEQINNLSEVITQMNAEPPKVEIKEKEVVVEKKPTDYEFYKEQHEDLKTENKQLSEALKQKEQELLQYHKSTDTQTDKQTEKEIERLRKESDVNIYRLIININNFVKEQSVTSYDSQAIQLANDDAKGKLTAALERMDKLSKEIKKEIGGETTWIIN